PDLYAYFQSNRSELGDCIHPNAAGVAGYRQQFAQAVLANVYNAPPSDSTAPSVPTGLTATPISVSQINLAWTASTDDVAVTGYAVFRNGAQINTTATPNYSDSGLAAQTSYSYTVAAFDAVNNTSNQSTAAIGTTTAPDTTAPTVPTNLVSSNITTNSATISWSASGDNVAVAGYQIFRDGTQVNATIQTSYADSGLLPSTTYSYTVAAYDGSNNVSAQSATQTVPSSA